MSKIYTAALLQLQRSGKQREAGDFARLHATKIAEERGPISKRIAQSLNPMERALLISEYADGLRMEREACEVEASREQDAVHAPLPLGPTPETHDKTNTEALERIVRNAGVV